MKIIEIITTEQLNEALPGSVQVSQAISHLNPLNWLRSAASKLTSGSVNAHLSVKDLINGTAKEIAEYARSRGQNISNATRDYIEKLSHEIETQVEDQIETQLRNGKISKNANIDKIRKELTDKAWNRLNPNLNPNNKDFWSAVQNKAERDFGANMLKSVGQGVGGLAGAAGTLIKWGIKAQYAAQILKPFNDYNDRMDVAQQWVKSGQIPPGQGNYKDVNEWYQAYRSQELSYAIAQAGLAVATAEIGAAVIGKLLPKGITSPIWQSLGTLGKAYVAKAVTNTDTAKDVATLIADNLGIIGRVAAGGIDTANDATKGLASPTGDIVMAAVQQLNLLADQAQAADQGKQPDDAKATTPDTKSKPSAVDQASAEKPTANPQVDTTASPKADTGKPYDFMGSKPVDPNWAPKDKWIDLGNGYIKDPNTGTIDVRL